MDLNAEGIMWRLYALYSSLGYPTESNESAYYSGVRKIITQLEIYDQVCVARKEEESVQKANGGVRHSREGIELAGKIVKYLEENEGTAECFPYDALQVPDRASSKGRAIRQVEILSNKLLTTAFEASLECVTVM